jgi:hypothetical protein
MKQVKLHFDDKKNKWMIDDTELEYLVEEHEREHVEIVYEESITTKKTNLTRGEILRGIEIGRFKEGDRFVRPFDGTIASVVEGKILQYSGGTFMQFKAMPDEVWHVLLDIEVGDWVAKTLSDNSVMVSRVINGCLIGQEMGVEIRYANTVMKWKMDDIRMATQEEIKRAKRAEAFIKKGRLMNEYKIGDVLPQGGDLYGKIIGVDGSGVLISGNGIRNWVPKEDIKIPAFFVEDMVEVEETEEGKAQ